MPLLDRLTTLGGSSNGSRTLLRIMSLTLGTHRNGSYRRSRKSAANPIFEGASVLRGAGTRESPALRLRWFVVQISGQDAAFHPSQTSAPALIDTAAVREESSRSTNSRSALPARIEPKSIRYGGNCRGYKCLAAAAGGTATHAAVAGAVADHDGSAGAATGRVAHVVHLSHGV